MSRIPDKPTENAIEKSTANFTRYDEQGYDNLPEKNNKRWAYVDGSWDNEVEKYGHICLRIIIQYQMTNVYDFM